MASLQHKFTPRSKIFSVLWSTVVWNELIGRSSMDGFFPTTPKNTEIDQNGLWWHLTWDSLCHSCGEFWQLARQTRDTDTTDTVDTPVHVSYCLIHDLLCKRLGSKVSNFTRSNAVFFVVVASTNFRVWLFSHLNFCFKPCRRLNGSQETLLGLFLWLDDKQCSIFEFLSCFLPFLLPSPVPLLPPILLGSRPPVPPPLYCISLSVKS